MTRLGLLLCCLAPPAFADPAQIVSAEVTRAGETWRVSVTLRHGDTGWEDYADGWRVETPDGSVIGTRELLHPHVEEQPFTRSLSGVTIPEEVGSVVIRARTLSEGWGEEVLKVKLSR